MKQAFCVNEVSVAEKAIWQWFGFGMVNGWPIHFHKLFEYTTITTCAYLTEFPSIAFANDLLKLTESVVTKKIPCRQPAGRLYINVLRHFPIYIINIQSLPLLAMIHPVEPVQLLQIINSYNPTDNKKPSHDEGDIDTGNAFITYDMMSDNQKELVDNVLEEHEDFDQMLAVQCINELKEDASLGMYTCQLTPFMIIFL